MNDKLPIMAKIGTIFLTWRRYEQRDLNPHKITLKQLYVLNQLTKKVFLYPSQVAEMLFCDRPTATVIIKNLERENWVRRERDAENGKQVKLFLTPAGQQKLHSIQPLLEAERFDPLACFSEEEKAQLDTLLTKLRSHLKKIE